ncbi:hypothetical protein ACIA7R_27930 [Micromonospora chalcea]
MNNNVLRGLWLAWALLLSTIIAAVAGLLAHLAGRHPLDAVGVAAAAFVAGATLLLLILAFIGLGNGK